jgi:sterol desaturase/sphingolipid hydroxylase (fatty acid hydroxylase superfamily)
MLSVIRNIAATAASPLPIFVALCAVFTALSLLPSCNPGRPWWRKRELPTDLCYWFVVPLFLRYARIGCVVVVLAILYGAHDMKEIMNLSRNGFGPLAHLPLWGQIAAYLLVGDFISYWRHRAFHTTKLWNFHAIHHSSNDLHWISSAQFHPLDALISRGTVEVGALLVGIPPYALIVGTPIILAYPAFVHANLNVRYGVLDYLFVSPVFHRWHHTSVSRGGSTNFSGMFSFYDLLFGTFSLPKGELPAQYGVEDKDFPKGFIAQLLYPFNR